jgi:hypothetical protein
MAVSALRAARDETARAAALGLFTDAVTPAENTWETATRCIDATRRPLTMADPGSTGGQLVWLAQMVAGRSGKPSGARSRPASRPFPAETDNGAP